MWNSKKNRRVLIVSALIIIGLFIYALSRDTADLIPLKSAQELLSSNQVNRVIATEDYIYLKTDAGTYKVASSQVTPKMFVDMKVEISTGSDVALMLLSLVLVLGAGSLAFRWWQRHYGDTPQLSCGSTGTKSSLPMEKVSAVKSDVTFADIGGISDVKIELEEIIDFMRNPKRYLSFGARMPRGVLLVGPPGVGKTMIAKAVAGEADVPFYYQSGASFVQIYVGMGAKRVHELFSAAKANTPSIIFIDEIDAVGKKRDGSRNDEREATLNQLLTEMDGFEDTSGVIVVAATNKIDVLDSALLRSGRFDRRIFVDMPTPREREAILEKYLSHIPHDVQSAAIAKMTVGFNGASLAALVNEAALLSLRQNDLRVTMEHFYQVKDKVIFGKKKVPVLTEQQKACHARYQAGKAFAAQWFNLDFDKVVLTGESIRPPISDQLLKHEIEAHVKVLLAGMAACELRFDEHAANAEADVEKARALVFAMHDRYAMGETLISAPGDKTKVLNTLYDAIKALLHSKREALESIESVLIERENISKEAIKKIVDAVL